MTLCMGGNDFVPKLNGITHMKFLDLMFREPLFLANLFQVEPSGHVSVNEETLVQFIKWLYTPRKLNAATATFEDVRMSTILATSKQSEKTFRMTDIPTRSPQSWLPPRTCLIRLAKLVQIVGEYIATAGTHDAHLPNFAKCPCLHLSPERVQYDFGAEASADINDLLARRSVEHITPQ
jgi:hypothetical protein